MVILTLTFSHFCISCLSKKIFVNNTTGNLLKSQPKLVDGKNRLSGPEMRKLNVTSKFTSQVLLEFQLRLGLKSFTYHFSLVLYKKTAKSLFQCKFENEVLVTK